MNSINDNRKIGIIGAGYVGLPLAIEFSKFYSVIVYDINDERIKNLKQGFDTTGSIPQPVLKSVENLTFTSDDLDLIDVDVYIVTVPTPIDSDNLPDLKMVLNASLLLAKFLSSGDLVIYESTVFPGATDEYCIPILERNSGLVLNEDFWVGYSPERVSPGRNSRKINDIVKLTSGSNEFAAELVNALYSKIIDAGTFRAKSIKVAEAAKVIENIQRDVNIALMNEFSKMFNKLDLQTSDVLSAAKTKWNFLDFSPGLVGGHCIGVDPYYAIFKSRQHGYEPSFLELARQINESMVDYIIEKFLVELKNKKIRSEKAKALVLGISFKENCPDCRNSKSIELINKLSALGISVTSVDPVVKVCPPNSNIKLVNYESLEAKFDVIFINVVHDEFKNITANEIYQRFGHNIIVMDLKDMLETNESIFKL